MGTVCQKCGDVGFSNALIYCVKCQVSAEHRYCLFELYDTFDEDFNWTCEDCLPQITKQSISGNPSCEQVAELVNSVNLQVTKHGASYVSERYDYLPSQPIIDPIWRGSFSICGDKFGTVNEMAAHLSTKACTKVFEAAQLLPALLPLQVHPRLDLWPNCYNNSQPTDEQIGLYLLPERERDETLSNGLLDDLIDQDLAMKAVFDNSELLVFTSLQLTEQCWRFRGKHYLWGVFRIKQPSPRHQSDDHLLIQSSNNAQIMRSNIVNCVHPREERNLITVCGVESPHGNSGIWDDQLLDRMESDVSILKEFDQCSISQCLGMRSIAYLRNLSNDNEMDPSIATSILDMAKAFTELSPDETSSADNSTTQVGPYSVLPSLGPILEAIIAKYGDIAQDCLYQSVSLRSSFLEALCNDIKMLQKVPFTRLKGHHLKSLKSTLIDAESTKLDVKWLRNRVDELSETMHLLKQYDRLKEALTKGNEAIESKKIVIDSKKADMMKLKSEIQSLENNLGLIVAKTEELDSIMSNVAKEYKFFQISLVDELL